MSAILTTKKNTLLPDIETQIEITTVKSHYIPVRFLYFHKAVEPLVGPNTGFEPWPYQLKLYETLFQAWDERRDGIIKQTRQSGKTVPTAIWLAYMICMERCQVVIISTKTGKTKKMARYIIKIMRAFGLKDGGVGEARFQDEAGFVCMSGKADSEREGDTAHIVLVDEAQDVPYDPVFKDISPMRAGTNGILLCMGIGGAPGSMIRRIQEVSTVLRLEVGHAEVTLERPSYEKTVEKDRMVMTPQEFDANYNVRDIDGGESALIPYLPAYEEVYPGKKYLPESAEDIIVGIDWGNRVDYSAMIAVGLHYNNKQKERVTQAVLFSYALFRGISWEQQLELAIDFIHKTPCDIIRPEFNNSGDPMSEFLEKRLIREMKEKDDFIIDETNYQPVFATGQLVEDANRALCVLSYHNGLLWAPDINNEENGLHHTCVNMLKEITVSYTVGNKMKTTHSDWGAALRCVFYPARAAHTSVRVG